MRDEIKSTSKFLSLVLRHQPQLVGITLDDSGWTDVDALLAACARRGKRIDRALLERVVAENDKRRFSFSEDGLRIRASQGHSVEVRLGYAATEPPELLYHGTAERNVPSIRATGLNRASRHAVHLSETPSTATAVGSRHGKPIVLTIRALDMHRAGHKFERSANGVWLVESVPAEFIVAP